jgi:hypothetical protein
VSVLFWANGVNFDDLFDPDVIGDGPTMSLWNNGPPLRYAALKYGQQRADVGFSQSGVDAAHLWAAKGTAVYALAVDGKSYSSNNQSRGQAAIRMTVYANGTYDIRDWRSDSLSTVLASGTWLTDGSPASQWAVSLAATHANDAVIDGGTTGATTTAANPTALTGNYYGQVYSQATLTSDRASCTGTIVCRLYKNGALRSTTTVGAYTNVNGN